MSNMSYCRFRNTLRDLQDCHDALEEGLADLPPEEERAAKLLVTVCREIAEAADFGDYEPTIKSKR